MASPIYEQDVPSGLPTSQQLQSENAFREAQNALRRRVLPSRVEQEIPDLAPLSSAMIPEQTTPSVTKLIIGGILRQRLGVDVFAGSRAKATRDAQQAYFDQTNNMAPVSLDAIAQQIDDPAEREAYQRRVAGLSPLERRILEAQNPGAYSALPAETLKLLHPGSVDPTDVLLQRMKYFTEQRNILMSHPDTTPDLIEANKLAIQRLEEAMTIEHVNVSPGGIVTDQAGRPIARGREQATSADNFVTPTGVEAAIPGTPKYFDFVARGYRRAPNEQTVTTLGPVDKTVERDFQKEALKARFAVERLKPIRQQVLRYGELTRPLARMGTAINTWEDALGLASEAEKTNIRQAREVAGSLKNEFALLVQNLTGAAASENQLADYEFILSNWDTYSPTVLLTTVQGALVRGEDLLARRFAYDELRQSDEGLRKVAPWEMSTQRAQSYFLGAVSAVLQANQNGPFTEQELRQQAINAIGYEAGVSTDAIERILRGYDQ